ncbi:MAG: hypothetical protein R6U15_01735 [Candidatus Izemoplasmatales bacterium]
MKIEKIKQDGDIFKVTKKPNLIQHLFGVKKRTELYKDMKITYKHFPDINAYHDQQGNILKATDKIVTAIESWKRAF